MIELISITYQSLINYSFKCSIAKHREYNGLAGTTSGFKIVCIKHILLTLYSKQTSQSQEHRFLASKSHYRFVQSWPYVDANSLIGTIIKKKHMKIFIVKQIKYDIRYHMVYVLPLKIQRLPKTLWLAICDRNCMTTVKPLILFLLSAQVGLLQFVDIWVKTLQMV